MFEIWCRIIWKCLRGYISMKLREKGGSKLKRGCNQQQQQQQQQPQRVFSWGISFRESSIHLSGFLIKKRFFIDYVMLWFGESIHLYIYR